MAGTAADHLHFGVLKNYSSTTKEGLWAPLERYYPQGWNAGKDLDYICAIQHAGNAVKATAYVMNDGVKEYLHTHDVWLCHRKAGTSYQWQQELMSLVSGSQTQWSSI
ncbi:MAG: hypothetical protein K6T75_08880 [Acetobacteraceae bacterium]|nr:hypothetical protein [Acetobacteraceae bacterium]